MKGAVISSEATPDKNKLSTDTLTWSDIQNKAEYSASSVGVSYNTGKDVEKKDQGLTPNIGVTASGDANSTTKSAISPGTVEIRSNPNQDISTLSRDPAGAVNALGKIFDKKTVQEQQELANLFGEEVFKAIGDLGLKEGSPEKTALDAFAGGLMAKLGGGSFASGAAGAGFNQLLINELANIKNPAAMQWASAIVGAAAAKVVGGNAQAGASVAASETKNNYLTHEQYAEYQAQLKELKDKLDNGSITQKDYDAAVKDKYDKWSAIEKKQENSLPANYEGTPGVDMQGNEETVVAVTAPKVGSGSSKIDYMGGAFTALLPFLNPQLNYRNLYDYSRSFQNGYNLVNSIGGLLVPSAQMVGNYGSLTLGGMNPPGAGGLALAGSSGAISVTTPIVLPIGGTSSTNNDIAKSGQTLSDELNRLFASGKDGASTEGSGNAEKAAGDSIKFGSDVKTAQKLSNQMAQRGWTDSTVRDTVSNPYTTRASTNKATGNPSTVYYNQEGGYVIIDDVTKAVVQVSDNINPSTWIPDPSIINPYKP